MVQNQYTEKCLIRSSIRLWVPLKNHSEVIDILETVRDQIQVEPTCQYARLYRGANEVEIILIEELWEKEEGLKRHLSSNLYQRVPLIMEFSEVQPEMRFERVIETSGFENIQAARNQDLNQKTQLNGI